MASYWTGGPHATSGLAGYPARDFGAPGDTPVYAWGTLRLERVSGAPGYRGGGFGGLNLYLRDRAGRTYFMTHVENLRVKVGDVLRPGQQIAQVGNYGTPHVHLGYTGGDVVRTLGFRPEYLYTPGGAVAGAPVIEAAAGKGARLTPEQLRDVGKGIIAGDIRPEDLPPGSTVRGTGGTIPGTKTTLADVGDVVKSPYELVKWIGGNWDRVLEVGGGILLVLIGLVLMGRSLGVTKTRIELVERAGAFAGAREYAAAGNPPPARRENLSRPAAVHEVTDAGERAAARRARRARATGSGPSEDIPF